jgi:hypothetical protein
VRWRKTEVASPFIGLERRYDVWSKEGIAWAAFIVSVLKDKGNKERGCDGAPRPFRETNPLRSLNIYDMYGPLLEMCLLKVLIMGADHR